MTCDNPGMDLRPQSLCHHESRIERVPGVWEVARPPRWHGWRQWRRQWACRREHGHCYHPEGMVDWWCCMCGGETDGWPPQRCRYCPADGPAG